MARTKCMSLFKTWWRAVFDCVTITALFVLFLGIWIARERGVIVRNGFFCDDPSIRLPYRPSTVPSAALVIVTLFLPPLAMICGNIWERYVCRKSRPGKAFHACGANSETCLIPHWIARICYEARWFVVGFLITEIITDIGKMVVGRLRPNFLDECDPDFTQFNCTDQFGNPRYVLDYTCRGDPGRVSEARVSWPSGHSSLTAYAFIFLTLYISCVRSFHHRSAMKALLMMISFLLAMLTGLSRVTDHKHHPIDVLSGWIIGTVVAFIVVYYSLRYFGEWKKKDDLEESNSETRNGEYKRNKSNTHTV